MITDMNRYFASPLGVAAYDLFRREHVVLAAQLREFLGSRRLPVDSSVADVGCGPGSLIDLWLSLAPQGTVVGIDQSLWCIRLCRGRFAHERNVHFVVGDIRCVPLRQSSFDLAVLSQISLPDFLNSCVVPATSILREGGRLLVIRPYGRDDAFAEWLLRVEVRVSKILGFPDIDEEAYYKFSEDRSDITRLSINFRALGLAREDSLELNLEISSSSYEEFILGMIDTTLFPNWRIVGSNSIIPLHMRGEYAYRFLDVGRAEYHKMHLQKASRSFGILLSRKVS